MNNLLEIVDQIWAESSTNILSYYSEKQSLRLLKQLKKVVQQEDLKTEEVEILETAALFYSSGLTMKLEDKDFQVISAKLVEKYLFQSEKGKTFVQEVKRVILNAKTPNNKLEQLFSDTLLVDFVSKNALKNLNKLYQDEFLLGWTDLSEKAWLSQESTHLKSVTFYSQYGQNKLKEKLENTLVLLQKSIKQTQKKEDIILQMELGTNESELKALKKKLKSVEGRDDRAIQTLFRTTSKNHYTLGEMIDRKANIIISVTAIILSLVVSGLISIGDQGEMNVHIIPLVSLTIACLPTIVFSILAIRPISRHYQKEDTKNVLFFGDFAKMNYDNYREEMYKIIDSGTDLYDSMIFDLYHFGKRLEEKYRWFKLALYCFMIGFIFSALSLVIIRLVFGPPDFAPF